MKGKLMKENNELYTDERKRDLVKMREKCWYKLYETFKGNSVPEWREVRMRVHATVLEWGKELYAYWDVQKHEAFSVPKWRENRIRVFENIFELKQFCMQRHSMTKGISFISLTKLAHNFFFFFKIISTALYTFMQLRMKEPETASPNSRWRLWHSYHNKLYIL